MYTTSWPSNCDRRCSTRACATNVLPAPGRPQNTTSGMFIDLIERMLAQHSYDLRATYNNRP